jgi:hypothetical protein
MPCVHWVRYAIVHLAEFFDDLRTRELLVPPSPVPDARIGVPVSAFCHGRTRRTIDLYTLFGPCYGSSALFRPVVRALRAESGARSAS